jgi:hypothetical protein
LLTKFLFLLPVPEDGEVPVELDVYNFKGPGIALAMYNVDEVASPCVYSQIC